MASLMSTAPIAIHIAADERGFLTGNLVDPHAVGLVVPVGNPGIEIAIAIEVAEGDTGAIGVTESLTTVGIGALSSREPDCCRHRCRECRLDRPPD